MRVPLKQEVKAHRDGSRSSDRSRSKAKVRSVARTPIGNCGIRAGSDSHWKSRGNRSRFARSVVIGQLIEVGQRGLLIGGVVGGHDLTVIDVGKCAIVVAAVRQMPPRLSSQNSGVSESYSAVRPGWLLLLASETINNADIETQVVLGVASIAAHKIVGGEAQCKSRAKVVVNRHTN